MTFSCTDFIVQFILNKDAIILADYNFAYTYEYEI